jgi:hypothetical protein
MLNIFPAHEMVRQMVYRVAQKLLKTSPMKTRMIILNQSSFLLLWNRLTIYIQHRISFYTNRSPSAMI